VVVVVACGSWLVVCWLVECKICNTSVSQETRKKNKMNSCLVLLRGARNENCCFSLFQVRMDIVVLFCRVGATVDFGIGSNTGGT
jgi:hypothetical protein